MKLKLKIPSRYPGYAIGIILRSIRKQDVNKLAKRLKYKIGKSRTEIVCKHFA